MRPLARHFDRPSGRPGGSREAPSVPFVELAARSAFSLLDGASTPEALAARAAKLGMSALALADRFDLGGAVRFTRACGEVGVRPILGAEILCRVPDRSGSEAAPAGRRGSEAAAGSSGPEAVPLLLLCMDREGYGALSSLITEARLSNPRGEPRLSRGALEGRSAGLLCLLRTEELPEAVSAELPRLHALFPGRLYLALEHHGLPEDGRRCAAWIEYAEESEVPWVPVNVPRYARPGDRIAHDVLTCLRHDTTLDEAGDRLFPNGEWYLKSAGQMRARWCFGSAGHEAGGAANGAGVPCGCPGCRALRRTVRVADRCRFRLEELRPRLPSFPVPGGRDADPFLRGLVREGARERYGDALRPAHRRQLEHELSVIARLGLADYFLIMWDIVRFARRRGILVQGRGSAANSAVCYCLGITAVDPVGLDLLFERFLSEERDEAPDIDLDIAHDDREEVLQYVYRTWGRDRAAMVCETITYRGRMAVRDAARVLGFPAETADALAAEVDGGEARDAARRLAEGGAARAGLDPEDPRTAALVRAVAALHELPRHRSIHVGGFVLSERPIGEVVPVEAASMPDRTIIQWDKDDLHLPGLVKFDLLGLGMLTVLGEAIGHVRRTRGTLLDLAALPPDDPEVYDMICAADTVGLFQIESRAQMNTLPRMRPRRFYDLVIEVALIRPGPIQGEMVHPYLRRRRGEEPVTYLDPRLEPVLARTLGIPLFQEQGMKVAITLAGFTPAQADRLRRAMGFKRSRRAMATVGRELAEGLARNGVSPAVAERVFKQLTAFANYGFPESHAASFALLVYASAYLKRHFAPEYFCAMLNAQPMGFYAPATLVRDAQRHGVEVRPVDLARSAWNSTLEPDPPPPSSTRAGRVGGDRRCSGASPGRRAPFRWGGASPEAAHADPEETPQELCSEEAPEEQAASAAEGEAPPSLRLGLRLVRGLGPRARERLRRAREGGSFGSVEDVVRRSGLRQAELRSLAEAGAFESLWPGRREALWELLRRLRGDAGPLAPRPAESRSALRAMTRPERVMADYRTTGLSSEGHPMEFLRPGLRERGVLTAAALRAVPAGREVAVAGIPICRQRPSTARGVLFITLEDETGFANFVVLHGVQERYRAPLLRASVLLLEGAVEREGEVVNVLARRARALTPRAGAAAFPSRDFR